MSLSKFLDYKIIAMSVSIMAISANRMVSLFDITQEEIVETYSGCPSLLMETAINPAVPKHPSVKFCFSNFGSVLSVFR